jgi:AraC-like DNA-binding protein
MPQRQAPIEVQIPQHGIGVFESVHDPAFRMDSRMDAFDKLILVGRGAIRVGETNPEEKRAHEGDVLYVPGGTKHIIEDAEPSTLFLLCLSEDFTRLHSGWRRLKGHLGPRIRVWNRLPFQSSLMPLWRRLMAEQERGDIGFEMVLQAETMRLLVQLSRAVEESEETLQTRVEQLVAEIERTSFDHWTIDEAARRAGASRRRFTALFREVTGKTFVEALTAYRMERVKLMLRSGGYSVAGAAFASGFGDLAHFYRTFKRYEGQTPLEWLEQTHPDH